MLCACAKLRAAPAWGALNAAALHGMLWTGQPCTACRLAAVACEVRRRRSLTADTGCAVERPGHRACRGEAAPAVVVEEAPAPGEPMDINTAVHLVLKKALAHDGLCRGLHEACRCVAGEDLDGAARSGLGCQAARHVLFVSLCSLPCAWISCCLRQHGRGRRATRSMTTMPYGCSRTHTQVH